MTDNVCNWTSGMECVHSRQRGYWRSVGIALSGSIVSFAGMVTLAITREPSWDAFWSNNQILLPNVIVPLIACLVSALVIPTWEKAGPKALLLDGIFLPPSFILLIGLFSGIYTVTA